MSVAQKLRRLRGRAGLSMADMANALGYSWPSGYQRYENPDVFTKQYLPLDIAQKAAKRLAGCGDPPITQAEVLALAGIDTSGGNVDGEIHSTREAPPEGVRIYERRIEASAGGGSIVVDAPVGDTWLVPRRIHTRLKSRGTDHLSVIEARGDSMAPTIDDGDPIWVSTHPDDLAPWDGGIYIITDGVGTMCKRLAYIPKSSPPRFDVISDNDIYPVTSLDAADLNVIGKVMAKVSFF